MEIVDTLHTWLVAKAGDDANGGHPSAYPVNLASDAKETIGAAITAAAAGDTIIIWPGTYTEQVVVSKTLTIKGTNREKCRVEYSTARAFQVAADGCWIENLTCKSTFDDAGGYGFNMATFDGSTIVNVKGIGVTAAGFDCCGATNVRLIRCIGEGGGTGLNIGVGNGRLVIDCEGITGGTRSGAYVSGINCGSSEAVFVRCRAKASRSLADDTFGLAGFYLHSGRGIVLSDCSVTVAHTGTGTPSAYGIKMDEASNVVISNMGFNVESTWGYAYDVALTDARNRAVLRGCNFTDQVTSPAAFTVTEQSAANKTKQFINNTVPFPDNYPDDYFNGKWIVWLTGNNAGEKEQALDWVTANNEMFFTTGFTHDIEVGDTYYVTGAWPLSIFAEPGAEVVLSGCWHPGAAFLSGIVVQSGTGWAAAINETLANSSIYR